MQQQVYDEMKEDLLSLGHGTNTSKPTDWFDPIKARVDKYFGKRSHEDGESRKILEKKRYFW